MDIETLISHCGEKDFGLTSRDPFGKLITQKIFILNTLQSGDQIRFSRYLSGLGEVISPEEIASLCETALVGIQESIDTLNKNR